jgi:hypothetical protein
MLRILTAASERDKALGQIEQYVARIEVHTWTFLNSRDKEYLFHFEPI